MKTERLYQKDVYLKEAELPFGEYINCRDRFEELGLKPREGLAAIWMPKTIFFPEGGGQPADLGKIGCYELVDCTENKKDGGVYHWVKNEGKPCPYTAGDMVSLSLDWKRRFQHMQQHCGEHILSGVFMSLYGLENRGFHMGADYVTVDLAIPEGSEIKEITQEMIDKAEYLANEYVWQNLPVTTVYFATREEANSQPVRKKIKFDEDISVVFVGDLKNPVDCCACCGTHPALSGEIGMIKVVKAENYKGMMRLTMKAGYHAFDYFAKAHRIITRLNGIYSSTIDSFDEHFAQAQTKTEALKTDFYTLKKTLTENETEKILDDLKEDFTVYSFDVFDFDDLQKIANGLEGKLLAPAALVLSRDNSALLVSDGRVNAGQLVKDFAKPCGGKGGGNAKQARALFPDSEKLSMFLSQLEKQLCSMP